ncbi:hypothetical protein B0T26DRAFT_864011 [Lasiosphaeria miniovina]|uniref:RNA-binding protein n=1 Tax=Lasiosphaeria miniovina TaxID=1954250 RepID=A0AA39ZTE3_9PEZI|nr:uncharacterized protein B0T26DRAFT_864011 [Lasiosphaeria miniovina]KAK0703193.1 hypothetical protein B0T26DRAFT_864011 [Lasiosphaeria miniovina]
MPDRPSSEFIFTTLVIKNIPFHLSREEFIDFMDDLGLPLPMTFNYHYRENMFRGLAFANYDNPAEASYVFDNLDGRPVHKRIISVEYKKKMPMRERERLEAGRQERRGQFDPQLRPFPRRRPLLFGPLPKLRDVDLNNPESLHFYTQLTLFKRNDIQRVMVFPNTMTPSQRRTVHVLAQVMNLDHRSIGVIANRQLHIVKDLRRTPFMRMSANLDAIRSPAVVIGQVPNERRPRTAQLLAAIREEDGYAEAGPSGTN